MGCQLECLHNSDIECWALECLLIETAQDSSSTQTSLQLIINPSWSMIHGVWSQWEPVQTVSSGRSLLNSLFLIRILLTKESLPPFSNSYPGPEKVSAQQFHAACSPLNKEQDCNGFYFLSWTTTAFWPINHISIIRSRKPACKTTVKKRDIVTLGSGDQVWTMRTWNIFSLHQFLFLTNNLTFDFFHISVSR